MRLYDPRLCDDHGVTRRYSSRARVGTYFYADNPLGESKGWYSETVTIDAYKGQCVTTARTLKQAGGDYEGKNYVGAAIAVPMTEATPVPAWLGGLDAFG